MASTTKDKGILLLFGLLLPAVLMSEVTTPTDTASIPTSVAPTNSPTDITTTLQAGSVATMAVSGALTSIQSSQSTGDMSSKGPNITKIYCPSFTCNHSDCYAMYNSQNTTSCLLGSYCQLMKQKNMLHSVGCSAFCADSCINATQTNCSMHCCNSTGCLNSTFDSMGMMRPTVTTTKAATTTTVVATNPQTANNGNKCHKGVCTDNDCYTSFKNDLQTCSSSEKHCQTNTTGQTPEGLKKETVNSKVQWTAGCIANCSVEIPCKSSTQPPCHLECCNATLTSCLWLNGTLNFPSFATRGPYLHPELIAFLLGLFIINLML